MACASFSTSISILSSFLYPSSYIPCRQSNKCDEIDFRTLQDMFPFVAFGVLMLLGNCMQQTSQQSLEGWSLVCRVPRGVHHLSRENLSVPVQGCSQMKKLHYPSIGIASPSKTWSHCFWAFPCLYEVPQSNLGRTSWPTPAVHSSW